MAKVITVLPRLDKIPQRTFNSRLSQDATSLPRDSVPMSHDESQLVNRPSRPPNVGQIPINLGRRRCKCRNSESRGKSPPNNRPNRRRKRLVSILSLGSNPCYHDIISDAPSTRHRRGSSQYGESYQFMSSRSPIMSENGPCYSNEGRRHASAGFG